MFVTPSAERKTGWVERPSLSVFVQLKLYRYNVLSGNFVQRNTCVYVLPHTKYTGSDIKEPAKEYILVGRQIRRCQ